MNGRPRWWWVCFAAGLAPVIAALAYVSVAALRLERREARAAAAAVVEESARAALWRMDSAMAPIVAREASRPYFHYQPFYPADRAYTSMWEEVRPGEVLVASPLLTVDDPVILLYFQRSADGGLTSPQAPAGNMRDLAESAYTTSDRVIECGRRVGNLGAILADNHGTLASLPRPGEVEPAVPLATPAEPPQADGGYGGKPAKQQAVTDYAAREQLNRLARNQSPGAVQQWLEAGTPLAIHPTPAGIAQGDMAALWVAGEPGAEPVLLLARRVRVGGAELIQGAWLDWDALRGWLLGQASDVLPEGAALAPVVGDPDDPSRPPGRRLAAIPASLVLPEAAGAAPPGWTPMRTTLALSWLAVLAAAVAAGVALHAAAELAERRGRFVSAVTHELRTPLTTFCLYTQMLDDGVVGEEGARREYVGTLRRESQRLARIVENVLEFARLGRRAGTDGPAAVPLVEALDRIVPVLRARAEESGLRLVVRAPAGELAGLSFAADPHAVEQILLNLVENACKYAAAGAEVEITAERNGGEVSITVSDRGPGICAEDQRRLFRPFCRGADLAHGAIPGLGLGLAVSRGLARRCGGEVSLVRTSAAGTAFSLTLPLAPSSPT